MKNVRSLVRSGIEEQMWNKPWNQVDFPVRQRAWDHVRSQVTSRVMESVVNRVYNQSLDQINENR